jgi:hypothetical protein
MKITVYIKLCWLLHKPTVRCSPVGPAPPGTANIMEFCSLQCPQISGMEPGLPRRVINHSLYSDRSANFVTQKHHLLVLPPRKLLVFLTSGSAVPTTGLHQTAHGRSPTQAG